MKYTLQQPGRSIYKLEQSIVKFFQVFDSWRLQEQGRTTYSVFFLFSEKKKQGRSANRKHTYFFFALADPTLYPPKTKFLIYCGRVALSSDYK